MVAIAPGRQSEIHIALIFPDLRWHHFRFPIRWYRPASYYTFLSITPCFGRILSLHLLQSSIFTTDGSARMSWVPWTWGAKVDLRKGTSALGSLLSYWAQLQVSEHKSYKITALKAFSMSTTQSTILSNRLGTTLYCATTTFQRREQSRTTLYPGYIKEEQSSTRVGPIEEQRRTRPRPTVELGLSQE